MKKKMLALILALSICFSMVSAYAVNNSTVEIVNGKFVSEEMTPAQDILDSFFSFRNYTAGVVTMPLSNHLEEAPVTEKISNDIKLRTQALKDFWLNENVEIISTSASSQVLSAKQLAINGDVDAVVYEWTWVDYIDEGCGIVDRMGFGTVHDMTLAITQDGTFEVVRDSYNEVDISGHVSADYDFEQFTLATENIDTMPAYLKEISSEESTDANYSIATTAATESKMPKPIECIKYADEWVEHDISSNASAVPVYNSLYGYFSGNDCCNFVSQCVHAGGLEMDKDRGWYHDMDGSNYHIGSAWISVSAFRNYWMNTRGFSEVTASNTSVFPGNPVYWIKNLDHPNDSDYAGNHVAICVGYNAAGNPIINGHTRNVYHQKLNTSSYKRTLLLNPTNPFIVAPKNATAVQLSGLAGLYLQPGKAEWFKFVAPSSEYYTVYTSGSADTFGYLYEGVDISGQQSNSIIYLKEIAHNGDAWGSTNCRFGATLVKGRTYYIMICGEDETASGVFNLNITKG